MKGLNGGAEKGILCQYLIGTTINSLTSSLSLMAQEMRNLGDTRNSEDVPVFVTF